MDRIGSSESNANLWNRLSLAATAYWKAKDAVLSDTGTQEAANAKCRHLRKIFGIVANSGDFHLIVTAEWIMCIADLEHFQKSRQDELSTLQHNIVFSALREGVAQLEEINDKLKLHDRDAHTFHRYSSGTRTIKGEHDRQGLPKDAIRKLLASHRTRLKNKNTGMDGMSKEELFLVGGRSMNLEKAERLYRAMQREALDAPGKTAKSSTSRPRN